MDVSLGSVNQGNANDYYSWECNSCNQLTGEPMKMLFIKSANAVTVVD